MTACQVLEVAHLVEPPTGLGTVYCAIGTTRSVHTHDLAAHIWIWRYTVDAGHAWSLPDAAGHGCGMLMEGMTRLLIQLAPPGGGASCAKPCLGGFHYLLWTPGACMVRAQGACTRRRRAIPCCDGAYIRTGRERRKEGPWPWCKAWGVRCFTPKGIERFAL